jgi:transcriptional regulator with XRE-family HTH domain
VSPPLHENASNDAPDGAQVGREIHRLRVQAGLSQRQAAQKMGINFGYLSRIERGQASPTLETLINIARGLGVPLSWLLVPAESRPQLSRASERARYHTPGDPTEHEPVFVAPGHMRAYVRRMGGDFPAGEPAVHKGADEMVVVLEGTITFEIDGKPVTVGRHDAIYLRGGTTHRVISAQGPAGSDSKAAFLSVVADPHAMRAPHNPEERTESAPASREEP